MARRGSPPELRQRVVALAEGGLASEIVTASALLVPIRVATVARSVRRSR